MHQAYLDLGDIVPCPISSKFQKGPGCREVSTSDLGHEVLGSNLTRSGI